MASLHAGSTHRQRYDSLDRLSSVQASGQPSRHYFYAHQRRVSEIDGDAQRSLFQHADRLLAQHRRQPGQVEAALLLVDAQQSVLGASGSAAEVRCAYLPYGFHLAKDDADDLPGFNGEVFEAATRHYPLGAGYRDYIPLLMRFNSPDSWSPFGAGGINAYMYCLGDPANGKDPTGHSPFSKAVSVLGDLFQLRRVRPRAPALRSLAEAPNGLGWQVLDPIPPVYPGRRASDVGSVASIHSGYPPPYSLVDPHPAAPREAAPRYELAERPSTSPFAPDVLAQQARARPTRELEARLLRLRQESNTARREGRRFPSSSEQEMHTLQRAIRRIRGQAQPRVQGSEGPPAAQGASASSGQDSRP